MCNLKQPSNLHNDFVLDQLETEEDCRSLLALANLPWRIGRLTDLPTNYSDSKQRERRPDKVIKAEVLNDSDEVIAKRIFLVEFKSNISMMALLLQLLIYMVILWNRYRLPVTPIIVYTGKRRIRHSRHINFRQHIQHKHHAVNEHDLDFTSFLVNLFNISVSVLLDKALSIAPGLYLAPRIFELTDEVVAEFIRLCAKLPLEQRKTQLEKGCTFIVKYSAEYDWDVLARIEQDTLPEEDCLMGRMRFGREAYGEERLHQGLVQGRAEGRTEAALKVALKHTTRLPCVC